MASSPSTTAKKHWWLTNKKIIDKYIKDAKVLIAGSDPSDVAAAVNLLDSALALSPRLEEALELKARCLLQLRRFKDVADMLLDYIPSCKLQSCSDSSSLSDNSTRERSKLLPPNAENSFSGVGEGKHAFKCISFSDLKKKVLAGLCKSCDKEGEWRYLVLGEACCHLGLMEDAMVLLQTGKRLATAAFRRRSVCWSDDSFALSETSTINHELRHNILPAGSAYPDSVAHLLAHIKWLLRRRAAALAAMDAGAHAEAVRHFTKIVESRGGAPQAFLAECYIHRAGAYQCSGRVAEAIADCNRTMAVDPASIPALTLRSQLLESIRAYSDCLRDLEHLKLLYDAVLRDRKLPGPPWRSHSIRYGDVAGKARSLTCKIQETRRLLADGGSGAGRTVDYHALMGLRQGCTRSELERAHLLLTLRHRPEKSYSFVDRCEFMDDRDVEMVKDQARMSSQLLYRLLQKGYSSVMSAVMEEEAAEKHLKNVAAEKHLKNVAAATATSPATNGEASLKPVMAVDKRGGDQNRGGGGKSPSPASEYQGVFCRDMAVVVNLLSQVGFNQPIPVKYEALSC